MCTRCMQRQVNHNALSFHCNLMLLLIGVRLTQYLAVAIKLKFMVRLVTIACVPTAGGSGNKNILIFTGYEIVFEIISGEY